MNTADSTQKMLDLSWNKCDFIRENDDLTEEDWMNNRDIKGQNCGPWCWHIYRTGQVLGRCL
jgi:hypothetical protein